MKSAFVTPAILFAAYSGQRLRARTDRLAGRRLARPAGVIQEVTVVGSARARRSEA